MADTDVQTREIAEGARVGPTPAWVDLAPYPIPAAANPHFIANGLCTLLDDAQIDLTGPERAWFYRRADLVTATAGAETASQFNVSIDPAFERVDVHSISIIRNGQRIEHSLSGSFETLRRERGLEQLRMDGRVTLHMTIPDVRVGDVVEWSHTLYGDRRSFGGRHSSFLAFEYGVGVIETRGRLRRPAARRIAELGFCNPPEGAQTEADGVVDRRWHARERRPPRIEPLAPPWTMQTALLQLSEWRDWAEVATVFTPLYDDEGGLPEDVHLELARIAEANASASERAAAVLRYVQGTVRYLTVSMGEGGFTPRPLGEICSTRYGDCKDKSKLFVDMARKLGIEACPALVNTRDGYALNTWLPSALVFDHCIVRLEADGQVYWVDPTRGPQPAPLSSLSQCHMGWALPLRAGVTALEYMPPPKPAHTLEVREIVTLGPSPDHAVRYEYRQTMRRGRAEFMREQLAREGSVGLFKTYTEQMQRSFGTVSALRQEVIEDNHDANTLTTLEVYEINNGWRDGPGGLKQFVTQDISIRSQLAPLEAGVMKHPIYLGQIGEVSRNVVIELAHDSGPQNWQRKVESSALTYRSDFKTEGQRRLVVDQRLEFRGLTMPGAEADKYRAVITEIDQSDLVVSAEIGRKGMFVGSDEHRAEERSRQSLFGLLWAGIVIGAFIARHVWLYYFGS